MSDDRDRVAVDGIEQLPPGAVERYVVMLPDGLQLIDGGVEAGPVRAMANGRYRSPDGRVWRANSQLAMLTNADGDDAVGVGVEVDD